MVCEHEQVLAIYNDDRHTRDNIHHYRCVGGCGRTDKKPFGKKIIYSDEKNKTEKTFIIRCEYTTKDFNNAKDFEIEFDKLFPNYKNVKVSQKVFGDNDYIEEQAKDDEIGRGN